MKKQFLKDYLCITLHHMNSTELAALYGESIINNYSDEYAKLIVAEITSREDGFDTLVNVFVQFYHLELFNAEMPLELQVVKKMSERGDLMDTLKTLIENNNLKNAIKVIAANCDWLPKEAINDELIEKVTQLIIALAS